MQRRRHLGTAFCLASLPLLLGNRGCEADLHSVDAQAAGGDAESAPLSSQATPGHGDAGAANAVSDSGQGAASGAAGSGSDAAVALKADASAGAALRCGTRGGVSCASDEFCDFAPDAQCGALDQGGVCTTKPQVCTAIYAPVCGCDTKTYASACTAHGAGVSVMSEGACDSAATDPKPGSGKTCGGIAALMCEKGEFCNYEIEAGGQGCEGIADGAGVCQTTPQACTLEYDPVCGCDHRTYDTACAAHAAGVSVLHTGMCTDTDCKAIGGRAVDGIGPAPSCAAGETDYGAIRYENGQIAVEGTICCVK